MEERNAAAEKHLQKIRQGVAVIAAALVFSVIWGIGFGAIWYLVYDPIGAIWVPFVAAPLAAIFAYLFIVGDTDRIGEGQI